jgi:hypothetical protein
VRSERGCLGSLPSTTRELLGLRAGLEGSPLSRPEAASQLGLSTRTAARLESRGLRALHVACGSGGGSGATVPASLVRLANGAPSLQPASYLRVSSAPALKPARDLDKPQGSQGRGEDSSRPFTGGDGGGGGPISAAAATSAAISDDGSGGPGPGLIVAMCLATLVALLLVGLRRRAVVRQRGATMTPAVAAPAAVTPAPAPAPAPVEQPREIEAPAGPPEMPAGGWSGPSAEPPEAAALKPSEQAARRDSSRASRAATVVASSVVSFAVRELARRRRRRS